MTTTQIPNENESPSTQLVLSEEDAAIKDQMEAMVDSYDSFMRKITLGREKALRDATINLAPIKAGDNVLEVGCGTGTLTMAAKRKVGPNGKVYGIDIIPGMVDLSKQKAKLAGLDISFDLASIENIPYADNTFDVVMCSFMIFHMSEEVRNKGIIEIYRVLKPQGKLIVLDLALPAKPLSRAIAKAILGGGMLKHDLKELVPPMKAAGFFEIEIAQVPYRIWGFPILSCVRGNK